MRLRKEEDTDAVGIAMTVLRAAVMRFYLSKDICWLPMRDLTLHHGKECIPGWGFQECNIVVGVFEIYRYKACLPWVFLGNPWALRKTHLHKLQGISS